MKKLTSGQKLFCHEHLIDNNTTQAAIRAGFSKKTAHSIGSRFLNHEKYKHVKEYLNKLTEKKQKKLEITADYVLNNIKNIGENCIKRDKESGALKAQELLGRWLRLFEDDEGRETTVNVTVMPEIIIKGKPFKPNIGKDNG